ncbi:MAG: hypothetical protein WBE59_04300 [Candidatus Cybelea sp.]
MKFTVRPFSGLPALLQKRGNPLGDPRGPQLGKRDPTQVGVDKAFGASAVLLYRFRAASERFTVGEVAIDELNNGDVFGP